MTTTNELLLERLERNASKDPNKQAFAFLASGLDGGRIVQSCSYRELQQQTTSLAKYLLTCTDLKRGDRALLVYPPSIDFTIAFLACLKAGLVAVPVFPPNPARKDTLGMFATIARSSGATVALTNDSYNHVQKLSSAKQALAKKFGKSNNVNDWPDDLEWITTDTKTKSTSNNSNSGGLPPPPQSSDLAFLQYTSGSTSEPKGVMITHGNLGHNLTIITNELQASSSTIVVSWLPQYHDMGLIGSYLGILYCGGSGYYLSPLSFLQRPMLWMEAVSKYRGTHLQAPNFAYKLTARKFQASDYVNKPLDLSSVKHMINAAEPVDKESMDVFTKAFGAFGLPKGVIFPTYGLAEHTVFVCSGGKQIIKVNKDELESNGTVVLVEGNDNDNTTTTTLVGCGYPHKQNVDVKIVDRDSCQELPSHKVGEIWVSSPSKAGGYYNKPVETKEDFGATLANDSSKEYLRTGDLGFLYKQELFICGRLKDLIIVAGRNYYPQDLEATAEASNPELLRPGCSAAFAIDGSNGTEAVVLVMELREVPSTKMLKEYCEPIVDSIRSAITQEHSLGISEIVLLQTKTVPKTSSGKIARAWCRKGYLGNTLKVVYRKSYSATNGGSGKVEAFEIESGNANGNGNAGPSRKPLTPEEISELRALSKAELVNKLRNDVARLGQIPPDSIDDDTALVTILDSLSISQFHGHLQNSYATKLSDEYLFRETLSLQKLAEVVKLGYAPDDNDGGEGGNSAAAAAPQSGNAGGLAGALGCPPGVRCVIQ